jgi:hypothetical protein
MRTPNEKQTDNTRIKGKLETCYKSPLCPILFGDHHSVLNRLLFRLLSKNIQIKLYKIIILLAVLHGCEMWTMTLR